MGIRVYIMLGIGFFTLVSSGRAQPSKEPKKEPTSPRIVSLEEKLEAGDTAALDAFWQEVQKQGTPLIEPIHGDERPAWRGGNPVQVRSGRTAANGMGAVWRLSALA